MALAARMTDALRPYAIELAFLELRPPSIEDQVARLLRHESIRTIVVMPLLLFSAGHAKRDIPDAVIEAIDRLDQRGQVTEVWQTPALQWDPTTLALSEARCRDAARKSGVMPSECDLLLVGRGSSDPIAVDAVRQYADRLASRMDCRSHATAFVAAATPTVADGLQQAIARGNRRPLLVVPHLLFAGEVLDAIEGAVRSIATTERTGPSDSDDAIVRATDDDSRGQSASPTILVARHLGADRALADAFLSLSATRIQERSTSRGKTLEDRPACDC
jgi:sirohydrochlorin ferrochelatase